MRRRRLCIVVGILVRNRVVSSSVPQLVAARKPVSWPISASSGSRVARGTAAGLALRGGDDFLRQSVDYLSGRFDWDRVK